MDQIRAATVDDAASIAHVHVASWRSTYHGIVPQPYLDGLDEAERTEDWRTWLAAGAAVFVAERNSAVVGFIAGGAIRKAVEGYDAEAYTIYLLQQYQRQGIGIGLLNTLAMHLRNEGLNSMVVWVLEDNVSAGFYTASGAVRVGSKEMDIGGKTLLAVAYGWPRIGELIHR